MNRKTPAPTMIGILIALYVTIWISSLFFPDVPGLLVILLGTSMLALLFLWIYVVKERLDEMRSGEEDDLSKY